MQQSPMPIEWDSQARVLIAKAEGQYLSRDPTFDFLGVRFHDEGPQIRFSPQGKGVVALDALIVTEATPAGH